MADFDVVLGGEGIEFRPKSEKASDWLLRSGKAKDLVGPNFAIIIDPTSANVFAEAIYRNNLTWHDAGRAAGKQGLLPTASEYESGNFTTESVAIKSSIGEKKGINSEGCGIVGIAAAFFVACCVSLVTYCSPANQPKTATPVEAISNSKASNEADAVVDCDDRVKASLVSRDSWDADWDYKYLLTGTTAEVMRHYSATNGFGARLSSTYNCKYDTIAHRIIGLQTLDANGLTTLVQDPLEQPVGAVKHRHHHHRE